MNRPRRRWLVRRSWLVDGKWVVASPVGDSTNWWFERYFTTHADAVRWAHACATFARLTEGIDR